MLKTGCSIAFKAGLEAKIQPSKIDDLSLLTEYFSDLSKTYIYAIDSGSFKGLE